jgi:LysM repeat protein
MSSGRVAVGKRLVVSAPKTTSPRQPLRQAASVSVSRKSVIHKVQAGETLNHIATAYKTTVDAILSWNKSSDLTVIHPGDQITIFLGNR